MATWSNTSSEYQGSTYLTYFKVNFTETTNGANANTSTITATVTAYWQYYTGTGTTPTESFNFYLTIGDTTLSYGTSSWTSSSTIGLYTATVTTGNFTVSHGVTGAGTCTIAAGGTDGSFTSCTVSSYSRTLTAIARGAYFSSYSTTPKLGASFSITTANRVTNTATTVRLYFKAGSTSIQSSYKTGTPPGTSWSGTYPTSSAFYSSTSWTKSGNIILYTYIDSTLIGTTSQSVSWTVPSYTLTASSTASRIAGQSLVSGYVRTLDQLQLSNSLSSAWGSTTSGFSSVVNGTTLTGATPVFDMNVAGDITYTVTGTDSRGVTATTTGTVNVLDYTPPTISLSAARDSSTATTYTANGSSVRSTEAYAANEVSLTLKNESEITLATGTNSLTYNGTGLALSDKITLTLSGVDSFGQAPSGGAVSVTIPAAMLPISFGGGTNGTGVAFGGFSTEDQLQCYLPANFTNGVQGNIFGTDYNFEDIFVNKASGQIGSATQPVYIDSNHTLQACTDYSEATFNYAATANTIDAANLTGDILHYVVSRGVDTSSTLSVTGDTVTQQWTLYSDGYKEINAWAYHSGSLAVSTAWGPIYYYIVGNFNYTTACGTFTEVPQVMANLNITGGRTTGWCGVEGSPIPTTTTAPQTTIYKGTSQSCSGIYFYWTIRGY